MAPISHRHPITTNEGSRHVQRTGNRTRSWRAQRAPRRHQLHRGYRRGERAGRPAVPAAKLRAERGPPVLLPEPRPGPAQRGRSDHLRGLPGPVHRIRGTAGRAQRPGIAGAADRGPGPARQPPRLGPVSSMFVKLAQFVTIMLYVLVAGVMWGTWLSLGRTMTRYDAATFLADGKHMIANLATIMAVFMISAAVGGLPHAAYVPVARRRRRGGRCRPHNSRGDAGDRAAGQRRARASQPATPIAPDWPPAAAPEPRRGAAAVCLRPGCRDSTTRNPVQPPQPADSIAVPTGDSCRCPDSFRSMSPAGAKRPNHVPHQHPRPGDNNRRGWSGSYSSGGTRGVGAGRLVDVDHLHDGGGSVEGTGRVRPGGWMGIPLHPRTAPILHVRGRLPLLPWTSIRRSRTAMSRLRSRS